MGRGMMAIIAVGERHAEGHDGGTVAEVAARLEKDRSQVSRSLKGALQEGFLARSGDRAYRLDWSFLTDAQLVTEQRLRTDGLTALEGLATETNEACFLGVLSGNSTVTIAEHVPANAEPGLYSLSAPIRDFKGEVAAALQIVGPKSRLEPLRESHALALNSWRDWLEARVGGTASDPSAAS